MRFPGKTALVTGAAGTLGSVIAHRFFDEGANLVLPLRTADQRGSISSTFGVEPNRLHIGVANLADEARIREFVREAIGKFRTIDFLVNTAGGYAGGRTIDEVSLEEWETMMEINLRTAFLMCRAVLPGMKENRFGRIINIAAMSAVNPGARRGPYQISKSGVITLTKTIAEETRGGGITANAIAPSTILTDANKRSMPDADFSRWIPPGLIAEQIVCLCADEARFITGNVIGM